MNKKGLIVATGVLTALTLSACGTNNNAMNDHKRNVGYEKVNFNRPTNPYAVNYRYENVNYPNNQDYFTKKNYHYGNDRINEGLSSEYSNDGVIHDGTYGRNVNYTNRNYTMDQVRYNNDLNTAPLVPYTNISTNTNMNAGERKFADQISKRVEEMSNVSKASTVAVGDQVLIAVDLVNKNVDESAFRSKIKDALSPYTSGKKVYVTFDGTIRNNLNNITNNVPNATKNVLYDTKENVKHMYRNVKNDVKDATNPNR
ncbi:YhcN/YlaJ family sporulation lipoprotein [Gottfriedia acidiceleris]|uniref:YhcN/YlaJ family sporulation lipoprotein n=1 Tax=Gottfriedia acidiceleris TaxID=371036 RepID=UPI003000176C